MNTGKTLVFVLMLVLTLVSGAATAEKDLQKKFRDAVEAEDYDLIFRFGRPLTRELIAGNQMEAASLVYREMASACFFRGEFSQAVAYCASGLALLNNSKSPALAFKHTSTISQCYANLSLIDSAGYWFMKSEELLDHYPFILKQDASFVKAFYNNLGAFHLQQQDTHRALLYYEKALDLAIKKKDKRATGVAYNSLANYYFHVVDYDHAKAYYQTAITFFDPESIDKCWVLLSLSNNEFQRKQYKESLSYAKKSRELYQVLIRNQPAAKHLLLEKHQLIRLSECYYRLERLDDAETSCHQCIKMSGDVAYNRSEELAYCYLGLGRIYESKKNWNAALKSYQQALIASSISFCNYSFRHNPPTEDALSSRALLDILTQKAACLQKIPENLAGFENYEALAFDTYKRAVDEAEKLRKNMSMEASKLFFTERLRSVFDDAIALGYRVSHKEQTNKERWIENTIMLAERSRRVALTDVLHERYVKPLALSPQVLEKEILLRKNIAKSRIDYANESDNARRDSIRLSMINEQVMLQKLLRQMEIDNPGYLAQRHHDPLMSVSKIRSRLDDNTAYLGYYFAKDRYYIYVITHKSTWISRLEIPVLFDRRLDQLQQALTTDPLLNSFAGVDAVEKLYAQLIAPAYEHLRNYQRWFIVRDGRLNLIPFEVLREKGKKKPLTTFHGISYLPGADFMTSPSGNNRTITNMIGFAPYHKPQYADSASWLPRTENEIRSTSNLFFLGPEATKEQCLKIIGQADALHLATHAQYNDSIPENSYLSFSLTEANNRLFSHEIAGLPLGHIKLAILSFCDAERGKIHNGEGMLSLARAFRMAGCPGMLATTWKADDKITSYLVETFYTHLKAGESPDIALQKARSEYFSSELGNAHNHPYYWANLIYIGDTSPLFSPALPLVKTLIYYGVVPLFLLLLAFYHYRRNAQKQNRFSQSTPSGEAATTPSTGR